MTYMDIMLILESTIRIATPLLLACLAGLYSERAGVFDIGLEGKMLLSACIAAAFAYYTGNAWAGLGMAIIATLIMSGIHGLAAITFRGNQLISGVAINFLAAGMTVMLANAWFGQGGRTPQLQGDARFSRLQLPFVDQIKGIDYIGPFYSRVLSGHSILTYAAFVAVPLTWWLLYRTRFGLRLRAVGENPAAVDTAGISVVKLRYAAVGICAVLCAMAGAQLATAVPAAGFVKDMTANRGYIALAALIFAKWRPWQAMWACLLFGVLQAAAIRYQSVDIMGFRIPGQFMDALPYILTVIILAGFVGKAIGPRAGGIPYVKER
ncbi:simple sugar transport system permease protein [Ketogulonicigenium robustum]|uniref:Simple sugar transport system permease protein n=1 Tax=Ketogulonicigenium robustum TaxID=92947 RepID=A0A1W6NXT6_9RHOB|nr:ABC transporter permease [Ketogulonicigenium robustum]ARO13999.1 simple sugar transport system permease protein [Ketogulonicigenium robustum]